MKYVFNQTVFKQALSKRRIRSLFDFAQKSSIHRNTVLSYLEGKNVFSNAFVHIAEFLKIDPLELLLAVSDTRVKVEGIDEIRHVIAALAKTKKIAVVLLGSRARGKHREYSDWDIGITGGDSKVTSSEYLKLKNITEEISENVPRMVDLVNLDAAPSWFLKGIDYEPVFLDGNKEAHLYFKGVLYGIKKDRQI